MDVNSFYILNHIHNNVMRFTNFPGANITAKSLINCEKIFQKNLKTGKNESE